MRPRRTLFFIIRIILPNAATQATLNPIGLQTAEPDVPYKLWGWFLSRHPQQEQIRNKIETSGLCKDISRSALELVYTEVVKKLHLQVVEGSPIIPYNVSPGIFLWRYRLRSENKTSDTFLDTHATMGEVVVNEDEESFPLRSDASSSNSR
ncbi:hypothetical protein V1524DRAFT_456182 [Lipomyces starkeyi]